MNVAAFNMPVMSEEAPRVIYTGGLSLYREFEHSAGWNRDAVREFLSRDFESDPEINSMLLRCPPVFTSNHAPFFFDRAKDRNAKVS